MKNLMRNMFVSMVVILLCLGGMTTSHAQAMYNLGGFQTYNLPANDDRSTSAISITSALGMSSLNFFGNNYTQFYLNNNGNITFTSP